MPEAIKYIENDFDPVKAAEREWEDYNQGVIADDFEKTATGYAFAEGMQNRHWYKDHNKEDILKTRDGDELEHNQDTFNLIRDYYLQWAGMVKAGIPVYKCEAIDQENEKDKETARIVNGLHKYHYKYIWNLDTIIFSKLTPSLFKGGACYIVYYKGSPDNTKAPGKKPKAVLKQMVLSKFAVTPIGDYQSSLSECSGVICEMVLSVQQAMEMFPEFSKEILDHVAKNDVNHCEKQTREMVYLTDYGISPKKPVKGTCIQDRELIWHVKYHRPVPGLWENGKAWLMLEDKCWESELPGGLMPVEAVIASEKETGRPPQSPAFEGVTSQIIINDLMLATRKKAYIDANPDRYAYEGTILSDDGKTTVNGVQLGDGKTRTLRANKELLAMGVSPRDQIPWADQPKGNGIAFDTIGLAKNLLQSTMHINAEIAYDAPAGTPAELLKTQFTIGEKKLGPSQTILEGCLVRCWSLASMLMQFILEPNDTFVLVDAGYSDTITWKQENITEGLNHTFTSRIGMPTTAEAKLKLVGMVSQVFPEFSQSFDTEDIRIISNLAGMGIETGADPEIALAEDENRAIQNNEVYLKGKYWYIKNQSVEPEQNHKLHMKILSRLKVGKLWRTLSKNQQAATNQHYAQHAAMNWLVENKQVGFFGMMPRAEFDITMWGTRGVSVPPQVQKMMIITGSTYLEAMSMIPQQQPGQPGQPGMPGEEPPVAQDQANTEITTDPTTQIGAENV